MTQSFDEWFKKRHSKTGIYEEALSGDDDATYLRHEMRKAFQVGAQSKQAEINNLKQSYHGASIGHDVFIKQLKERHKAEIDKLQKRIDRAMKYTSESPLRDVSRKAMINFLDILKGKQDD